MHTRCVNFVNMLGLAVRRAFPRLPSNIASCSKCAASLSTSAADIFEQRVQSLEPRTVALEPEIILHHLRRRHAAPETLAAVADAGEAFRVRSEAVQRRDAARARRNQLTGEIQGCMMAVRKAKAEAGETAMAKATEDKIAALKADVAAASKDAQQWGSTAECAQGALDAAMLSLPNVLDPRVPDGLSDSENEVLYEWWPDAGDADKPLPTDAIDVDAHDALCGDVGWAGGADASSCPGGWQRRGIDFDAARQLSGTRFAVLNGQIARLERALGNFFMDMHCGGAAFDGASCASGSDSVAERGEDWLAWVEGDDEQRNIGVSGSATICARDPDTGAAGTVMSSHASMPAATSTGHGFIEVAVPSIVGASALRGAGQLPKFAEDLFAIGSGTGGAQSSDTNEQSQEHARNNALDSGNSNGGDAGNGDENHKAPTFGGEPGFLIPTAEVPLVAMHADTIFDGSELPLRLASWTQCFRAEAGSHGRDVRGLMRLHQFDKVELVVITSADKADAEHERLTRCAERCLRELRLPYRRVRLCAGDIGFSATHCYDLEVWVPSEGRFREVSSCSNCSDFQSRRANIRYRPSEGEPGLRGGDSKKGKGKGKAAKVRPQYCHTINGSALALGRTMIALLENHQRVDPDTGRVVIELPAVLAPYVGGAARLRLEQHNLS